MVGPVRFIALAAIVALGRAAWPAAQVPPPRDSVAPQSGSAVVRGRVIAADTGQPIRDGLVMLLSTEFRGSITIITGDTRKSRAGVAAGTTGANGEFEFNGVAAGKYRIEAGPGRSEGRYIDQIYPDPLDEETEALELGDGQVLDHIVVRLPRAGAIEGRILQPSGDPAAFAQVELVEAFSAGSVASSQIRASHATTDDHGRFRLFGLPPGDYLLMATLSSTIRAPAMGATQQPRTASPDGEPFPTYYPGTTNPDDAAVLRVRSGQDLTSIDFAVVRARTFQLRGLLTDPAGAPVGGASMSLERHGRDGSTGLGARTLHDGSFRFSSVPPGEATLTAYRAGDAAQGRRAQYVANPVNVSEDVEGLVVTLRPGATVRGTLVFDAGAPAADEIFHVRTIAGDHTGRSVTVSAEVHADRSFVFDDLFGRALIRVSSSRGWTLASVTCDGRDITDDPTVFKPGDTVRVTLSRTAGTLTGRVTNRRGTGVDGTIVAFSEDPARWHSRFTTTRTVRADGDGHYRLEGLRPGRYLVTALAPTTVIPRDLTAPFFDRIAPLTTGIAIVAGAPQQLDLKITTRNQR
jgi:protocatechuate 3,4-dioxygenase beta subunit